jgi:GTP-binding protein EngB required for normal cell division
MIIHCPICLQLKTVDTGFVAHERFKGGMLTVGCVGQPNVGKSSLMNALMGKKVSSILLSFNSHKTFLPLKLFPCDLQNKLFVDLDRVRIINYQTD